jgi:hypothetical protein
LKVSCTQFIIGEALTGRILAAETVREGCIKGNMLITTDRPILVIVRGLPGSGKTFLAAALCHELDAEQVVSLDPDAIDFNSPEYLAHTQALTAEGVDLKLHAYRFLRSQAFKAIEDHKIIIWNQPFTNLEIFNKMITNLRNHAQEQATELPILVVELQIERSSAYQRIVDRRRAGGHGPTEHTFERFVGDYFSFAEHGYRVVSVRGDVDVHISVAAVLEELGKLGREA